MYYHIIVYLPNNETHYIRLEKSENSPRDAKRASTVLEEFLKSQYSIVDRIEEYDGAKNDFTIKLYCYGYLG